MDLQKLQEGLNKHLTKCALCPHMCGVSRVSGEKGFCGAPSDAVISSAMAHHGEEPPISGTSGSGTIFFAYCNMKCVYCQNYQISQQHQGRKTTLDQLASIMIHLQEEGCHNINLVSPTIWTPHIVSALAAARKKGLSVPLVYNTGGYENPSIIKMLDGIVDIYMPDMRYSDNRLAYKYSHIKKYAEYNRRSAKEMFRQVGELEINKQGIAEKGLMIRLLVLPNAIDGILDTLDFIKQELSSKVYLSIMSQYQPAFQAADFPGINRKLTGEEYLKVVGYARELGFEQGYVQDFGSLSGDEPFMPDFSRKKVFRYYDQNS